MRFRRFFWFSAQPSRGLRVYRVFGGRIEQLDLQRRTGRVDQALARLPERQRMSLWLCAVEGLSYAEIARSLDTTEKSVKALVHRARVALLQSELGRKRAIERERKRK